MPRKNPHAVALGKRTSKKKAAASRLNGLKGGQPRRYRILNGELERLEDDQWMTLHPPYDQKAMAFLRRNRNK